MIFLKIYSKPENTSNTTNIPLKRRHHHTKSRLQLFETISGSWLRINSTGDVDHYNKMLGVGYFTRKMMNTVKEMVDFVQNYCEKITKIRTTAEYFKF